MSTETVVLLMDALRSAAAAFREMAADEPGESARWCLRQADVIDAVLARAEQERRQDARPEKDEP